MEELIRDVTRSEEGREVYATYIQAGDETTKLKLFLILCRGYLRLKEAGAELRGAKDRVCAEGLMAPGVKVPF